MDEKRPDQKGHSGLKNHKNPEAEYDKTRIQPSGTNTGLGATGSRNEQSQQNDATRIVRKDNSNIPKQSVNSNQPTGTADSLGDINADATRFQKRQVSDAVKAKAQSNNSSNAKANADATVFQRTRVQAAAPKQTDSTRIANSSKQNTPNNQNERKDNVTAPKKSATVTAEGHAILKKRFILEKVLGAGGMGVVYKAKDLVKVEAGDKDPYVAIKVLTEEFKEHPEAFIALQRESRKTQKIAHPNIVNVHDFDKDKDVVFMTMEFLEGKPLDKLIRQYSSTGLPSEEAINIIQNVSQALIYAHQQNIIHSDFKPGNIFVTDTGVTKVFDFGIARAVAKAEQFEENPEDKTIFDAGDLGALTPAYASMEMLNGLEPDIRDDIYALGCVAYELLTGRHPFNKIPADEAAKQNLKPKRIKGINSRQWKAIKKCLAFKREDRVASVEQFVRMMRKQRRSYTIPVAILLSLSIVASGYYFFIDKNKTDVDETEIRTELELKLRLENYQKQIDEHLLQPEFSSTWEDTLWQNVSGFERLLGSSVDWIKDSNNEALILLSTQHSEWISEKKVNIFDLYVGQIQEQIDKKEVKLAEGFLLNAGRYSQDSAKLESLSQAIQALVAELDRLAKDKVEQQRLADIKAKENAAIEDKKRKEQAAIKAVTQEFDLALKNVNEQLECTNYRVKVRNLETAVQKLRTVDPKRYQAIEAEIIAELSQCIKTMATAFPDRAIELRDFSIKLFNQNALLASIEILPKDPCDIGLAGLGSQSKRAICRDDLANLGKGPELVVIPAQAKIKPFAISKYEVSIAEFNSFCENSGRCKKRVAENELLPITGLTISDVNQYIGWLSQKSNKNYRLPTLDEWLHAAKTRKATLDPNRNCRLISRGISKGDALIPVNVGQQNPWGLVNQIGNASEWVYGKGRQLVAVGGSFKEAMDSCNYETQSQHSGEPDPIVGFRLLRVLE